MGVAQTRFIRDRYTLQSAVWRRTLQQEAIHRTRANLALHKSLLLRSDLPIGAISAFSNLGIRFTRTLPTRTRVRDAVYYFVFHLLRPGGSLRLLHNFPARGKIPPRTGN